MKPKILIFLIGCACITCSCATTAIYDNALDAALNSTDSLITKVVKRADYYELQILYTQIDRIGDSVILKDIEYRVNPQNYFYPASTVKFPLAVLTLEAINADDRIDRHTPYYVEGDTVESTFENDILQIFAISDNEANNRLFELLGQDRINSRLRELGAGPIRISHRLSTPDGDDVTTTPIIAYLNDSTTTTLNATINKPLQTLQLKKLQKGKGYYAGDSLVREPMDFGFKNYYPLRTQHNVLKRVIFPELYPAPAQFRLTTEQRKFLLEAMQVLPRELDYNPEEYYDSYGKFFIYGDKSAPIPEEVQIFNKVGYAYGTLTDCAYIRDNKEGVEFMITATLLVNKDGIFNDDVYEYENTGIPFLAALGREIYRYELNRK